MAIAEMRQRLVRLPSEAQRTIRALHPVQKRRVRGALDRLRAEPGLGKELTGDLAGWNSLRSGRLRIVYRAGRTTIDVAAIGPRSSIYLDAAHHVKGKSTRSKQSKE